MLYETVINQVNLAIIVDVETTEIFPKISSKSMAMEIKLGKILNINPDLSPAKTLRLMKLLTEHK